MLEACKNISFGIPNLQEKIRAGQVKAVVCETEMHLDDWFGANFGPRPKLSVGLPIGILDEIQILPSQWGKGLATPALKHCIGLCAKHSCMGVILNAVPQEKCPIDLVAWYQRHGFKIIGPSGLGKYMLLILPSGNSVSESEAVLGNPERTTERVPRTSSASLSPASKAPSRLAVRDVHLRRANHAEAVPAELETWGLAGLLLRVAGMGGTCGDGR